MPFLQPNQQRQSIKAVLNKLSVSLYGTGRTSVAIGVSANLELVEKLLLFTRYSLDASIWTGWNKFRQLVPLLVRGRLYSSCVRNSLLHGSAIWPVRKGNKLALQWAEMRMVRWMWGIKVQDRVPSRVETETRIRWYYLRTTAKQPKQVAMVWACAAKRRQWLGEVMYGVWSGGCQTKR